ncbi:MAG TPA: hypothetical protein VGQ83_40905 [Polyangia bacterium]|jgi:hypothetical protein
MASPGRPSQAKRQKERDRITHQKDKEAQRAQRKLEKSSRPGRTDGEDPDIAGIVPGPQPILE